MNTMSPLNRVPSGEDIQRAAERIFAYIEKTPVLSSERFNQYAHGDFYFKSEHLQQTGAFKARGAMNAVLVHQQQAQTQGVLTHSSGNHGAALSWAASQIGAKAYIVMPSNAPAAKIKAVEHYGGQITFCEPTLQARELMAAKIQQETGALLIHPYDNYDIIAGQATATYELLQEHPDLDQIFVPVGGGGLLAGAALANSYFGKAKVIGCEPEMAADAFESFTTKKWVPVGQPKTIADGLRTSLGTRNYPIILEHVDEIVLVSENEIEESWKDCLSLVKQFIEPSAATGIAAAKRLKPSGKVGIILCGGNMDITAFRLL